MLLISSDERLISVHHCITAGIRLGRSTQGISTYVTRYSTAYQFAHSCILVEYPAVGKCVTYPIGAPLD